MKKFAAIALALILAMSSMFATVGVAGNSEEAAYDNNELSFGFDIKDNGKGVVVDVESMKVYGLKPELTVSQLKKDYLDADIAHGFSMDVTNEAGDILSDDAFVGTGSKIVLNDGTEKHPFVVVIFGDLTGDSVIDVVDAAQAQRYHTGKVEAPELALVAGDADKDGEIDANDYSLQVNAAVGNDKINQNATGTEDTGLVEVDEQVYVSDNTGKYALAEEDVTLTFNDIEVDSKYFDISDVKYDRDVETNEIYGKVTITGKGLFHGSITLKIEVVSLLEKVVATVNEVIEDANLSEVVKAEYALVDGVADIKVNVNASKIIRGKFNIDMSGLNGLLTKIDEFKAEYLQEASLTVGDLAIAANGDFDRSAIKALVFDIAKGLFCDIANADDNVIKSYSGTLITNNEIAELAEDFNIDVVMTADADIDIDRVKAFAAKVSRYVAFDVVDGNAVIDITMPAGFATKVVDVLSEGTGDVAAAKAKFDGMSVGMALNYVSMLTADDISASSADEIMQAIKVAAKLGVAVDKVLDEVTEAKVTDVNGEALDIFNGSSFYLEPDDNEIGDLVSAIAMMLSDAVMGANIANYANDDVYTAEFDVTLGYRNISEKVIVNLDLFGAAETPDIIEETATYFSDIIKTLGLANVAAVSYDAENCRALATLNARELATNLTLNEDAFDGLYTDIKGYFDDNYGTATIVVGGKEIVTAGKINKSALKDLIFSAATGFFQDAANLGANNVLRSFNTVVTEADGTEHNFDLDFALAGSVEDVERVASIAAKVANYVSFEVVEGNAVVNVGLPAGMRNVIVEKLGNGDQAAAIEKLNNMTLEDAFVTLTAIDADHISEANAKEIEAAVKLVCSVDNLINKVLGKVSEATVTTVNGEAVDLLIDDAKFEVYEGEENLGGLVSAIYRVLSNEIIGKHVYDFVNADGTYTGVFDIALSIGGIEETITLNLDVFGDIEKENAIEDTVDYVEEIFAELGVASFASVELAEGKAVATFDATELLADGLKSFNVDAINGLYTNIKDYFNANFSDSTIKVGDFELVTDGTINKAAVKDLLFSAAAGFFTDVANMDVATLRSYKTVVTDAEGNKEEFVIDFNLDGNPAHIEKIKAISAKVAEHVSFKEVDGNAVVNVKAPAGVKNALVEKYGSVEAAKAELNSMSVEDAFIVLTAIDAEHISVEYADEIERALKMVSELLPVANKVIDNIDAATINVNGKNVPLLMEGAELYMDNATLGDVVAAVYNVLSEDIIRYNVGDIMDESGAYVFDCSITAKGITERITVSVDLF